MDEVFLWGTGFIANANKELFLNARAFRVKILGFIDNDIKKAGINFLGFPTYSREILYERHYNNIVICSDVYFNSIKSDILMDSQIKNVKVYSIEEFFYPKLLTKIRASIKSNDPEKDQKLQALQDASFDVYFPNLPRKISRDLVYFDDGMPYINFEGKRMYYPMGSFHEGGGGKVYMGYPERASREFTS